MISIERFSRRGTIEVMRGTPTLSGPLSGMTITMDLRNDHGDGFKVCMDLSDIQKMLNFSDMLKTELERLKNQTDPRNHQ